MLLKTTECRVQLLYTGGMATYVGSEENYSFQWRFQREDSILLRSFVMGVTFTLSISVSIYQQYQASKIQDNFYLVLNCFFFFSKTYRLNLFPLSDLSRKRVCIRREAKT